MTIPEEPQKGTADRPYKRRYGPLRLITPWVAAAVGVFLVARGVIELQAQGEPLFIYVGSGLIVLAVAFFFLYRWMARRGL